MDFYYLPGSPPCRAVQMAAKAVGVNLNLKLLNVMAGEQLKPEFVKINPQHTIPTLVDNGLALWESRAIMIYLAEKYGKDDSLYPKDPKARAIVNQRLFFDLGTLYQRLADYYYAKIFAKKPENPEALKKLEDAVGFLNTFLEGQTYVAGPKLTLADLALLATVSTLDCVGFNLKKYPNVHKWYEHVRKVAPGSDINEAGAAEFKNFISNK